MRVSEFAHQPEEIVEKQPLKVVVENGVRLAVVPFQARVLCPVDPDRQRRFTTAVTVIMAGMTISDAEVKPRHYTRDGQFIVADLTGTLPVFTRVGIQDAIGRAKAAKIEISGQGVKGVCRIIDFEVGDTVTQVNPATGDCVTLHGANRQKSEPRLLPYRSDATQSP